MAIEWTRVRDGLYRGGGYEILSDDDGWIVKHDERAVIDEPFATVELAKAAAERDLAAASAPRERLNWEDALDEVEALAVSRLGGLGGPAAGSAIRDVVRLAFQRGWEAGATAEGEYGPDFE